MARVARPGGCAGLARSFVSDGARPGSRCQAQRMTRRACLVQAAGALAPAACRPPLLGCAAQQRSVAGKLTGPRGLAFGPDGALYVAETGTAATGSRVSRIGADGIRHTVVDRLPYAVHASTEETGAAAIAFRHGELYILQGYGSAGQSRALLRASRNGLEKLADFAAFEEQYDPDGAPGGSNPFAMLYDGTADVFYVSDAGANDLLRVRADGTIEVVAVWRDNRVPVGLARGPDGALYVALFSPFPHEPGQGRIDRVWPDGTVQVAAGGLTMPIGAVFGPDGALYVLEFAAGLQLRPQLGFRPRSGRLLSIAGARRHVLLDRLPYPTALLAAPNGDLFVSLSGAFSPPESGAVVRVTPCR